MGPRGPTGVDHFDRDAGARSGSRAARGSASGVRAGSAGRRVECAGSPGATASFCRAGGPRAFDSSIGRPFLPSSRHSRRPVKFCARGLLRRRRARHRVRLAGDIFQANLSQRLQAPLVGTPLDLYRRLRNRNPAPFSAYLDFGDLVVASSSPERFLRVHPGGAVETRPIKGTRPRGLSPEHDAALARALVESDKDRAENVMIVDLLRNDLSRVCRAGTVRVPELFAVEHYATVHHLVSTVVGELAPEHDAVDLLRAAFPGGSITGAPKVRAMQIIAELEPTQRAAYCGAIGYLSLSGAVDTSIVIRTCLVLGSDVYFQVGGGIVADSDPEQEYRETLDKARGLIAALVP